MQGLIMQLLSGVNIKHFNAPDVFRSRAAKSGTALWSRDCVFTHRHGHCTINLLTLLLQWSRGPSTAPPAPHPLSRTTLTKSRINSSSSSVFHLTAKTNKQKPKEKKKQKKFLLSQQDLLFLAYFRNLTCAAWQEWRSTSRRSFFSTQAGQYASHKTCLIQVFGPMDGFQ